MKKTASPGDPAWRNVPGKQYTARKTFSGPGLVKGPEQLRKHFGIPAPKLDAGEASTFRVENEFLEALVLLLNTDSSACVDHRQAKLLEAIRQFDTVASLQVKRESTHLLEDLAGH